MSLSRALGFLITAAFIAVAAVSAQQPPAKTPPAKPGDTKTKPGDPKAADKAKNPPKKDSMGKKDDINWPKEVNGRKLAETVKDIRAASDPAVRETCIRALPFFGPEGRNGPEGKKLGAINLVDAMTKDNDMN